MLAYYTLCLTSILESLICVAYLTRCWAGVSEIATRQRGESPLKRHAHFVLFIMVTGSVGSSIFMVMLSPHQVVVLYAADVTPS